MTYYHWAADPVKLREMSYPQNGQPKPNGLWFDANEDWKRWCEATEFRLENLRYRHTVTILDRARILYLRSAKDIDAFTREYGRNPSVRIEFLQNAKEMDSFANQFGRDLFADLQAQFSNFIAWGEVAAKYSGIVIVPFSRARSQTYLWYYGWYCSSGCIWDTSIIRLGRPRKME